MRRAIVAVAAGAALMLTTAAGCGPAENPVAPGVQQDGGDDDQGTADDHGDDHDGDEQDGDEQDGDDG